MCGETEDRVLILGLAQLSVHVVPGKRFWFLRVEYVYRYQLVHSTLHTTCTLRHVQIACYVLAIPYQITTTGCSAREQTPEHTPIAFTFTAAVRTKQVLR